MSVGNRPRKRVGIAAGEELQLALLVRVDGVDELEGARIALALQRIDVRAEAAVVEPVDRLGRDVAAGGVGGERAGVGKEVGEEGDQVEQDDHDGAG